MKIARVQLASGDIVYGRIDDDHLYPFDGTPSAGAGGQFVELPPVPLSAVRLLAPCQPSKVLAIGRNYAAHAAEHGADVPTEPLLFLKPPSAVIGPGDPIILPALSQQIEHEGELVVVIGRRARHLQPSNALECVLGYTCGNDVTARDLQRRDGQWSRAKGFDTFCALGPWIETELDLSDQIVECIVNDEVRQKGYTAQMVFDVPHLLAYASAVMTLESGDVLMTGTPAGVGPLVAGDSVVVRVSGIGVLTNPVQSG